MTDCYSELQECPTFNQCLTAGSGTPTVSATTYPGLWLVIWARPHSFMAGSGDWVSYCSPRTEWQSASVFWEKTEILSSRLKIHNFSIRSRSCAYAYFIIVTCYEQLWREWAVANHLVSMLHIFWADFRLPAAIKQQILWRRGSIFTVPVSFPCRKSSLHSPNPQTFSLSTDPLSQPFRTFPRKDDTCSLELLLEEIPGPLLKETKGIKTLIFAVYGCPHPSWTGAVTDHNHSHTCGWRHSW